MITSRASETPTRSGAGERRFVPGPESPVDGPALIVESRGSQRRTVHIPVGWSRIGRSPAAEIRLDSPTVSRRHALIIRSAEGKLQIIDDRSLSGIELNGEPVRWAELGDGDELRIGSVRIIVAAEDRPARTI